MRSRSVVRVVGVMDGEFVELAEAIAVLREQLRSAQEAGEGQEPRLLVGRVEVELAVEARRDGGGEAGVQFGVFTLKGRGGVSSASTHRLRLELVPRTSDGEEYVVHGRVSQPPDR